MESNWRFNVWDMGMSKSNWRLAAYLVEPIAGNLENVIVDQGDSRFWFYRYVPGQLPTWHGKRILKGGHRMPHPDFPVFAD